MSHHQTLKVSLHQYHSPTMRHQIFDHLSVELGLREEKRERERGVKGRDTKIKKKCNLKISSFPLIASWKMRRETMKTKITTITTTSTINPTLHCNTVHILYMCLLYKTMSNAMHRHFTCSIDQSYTFSAIIFPTILLLLFS